MMKLRTVACVTVASAFFLGDAFANPVSLYKLLTDAGLTAAERAACVSESGSYASSFPAKNAFDGITGGTDASKRWLAAQKPKDMDTTYVQISLPDLDVVKNKRLIGYRLWRLFTSSTYASVRTPLEWEVSGLDANDQEVTLHSTVGDRVTWTGDSYEVLLTELQAPYKAFRFKPKYAPMMDDSYFQSNNLQWNVGLMEVEFLLDDYLSTRVFDPRFGDTIATAPAIEDIGPGTEVTLTATLAGETVFKRWEGLPTNAVVVVNVGADGKGEVSATFTMGSEALDVTLVTAPIWHFHADAPRGYVTASAEDETQMAFVSHGGNGVISNRVWQLNMTVADADARSLGIGVKTGGSSGKNHSTGVAAQGQAYTGYGNGILDLSGPILDASTDEKWTIDETYEYCLGTLNDIPASTNCCPTTLVVPETLTALHREFMDCQVSTSTTLSATSLTNLVIVSTNLAYIGNNAFRGSSIKKLTLKAPNLTEIWHWASIDLNLVGQDAAEIDLSGLETFGTLRLAKLTGTLRLPKLRQNNYLLFGISSASALDALELGTGWTPKDKAILRGINNNAQYESGRALLNNYSGDIVFGPYAEIVGVKFTSCTIDNITFQGKPFTGWETILPQLCKSTGDTRVYASAALGWGVAVTVDEADWTEAERTMAEEISASLTKHQELLGLYRSADDASKQAWIINQPSPYETPGLLIVVH